MERPLLLYSTNTLIAYAIAERFYRGVHYAWCSPVFDGTTTAAHINIPPTSTPAEIYRNLWEEVRRGELHSAMIKSNRYGIRGGANAKLAVGLINEAQRKEIYDMTRRCTARDFRPVLYIIPYDRVAHLVSDVPVELRAHPLSPEYRVEALPRDCIDMIEFRS
ncbi:MAG TPA: hypothetical protein VFS20_34135 [Longimicrobium sp.]|nr:hypothetical protein [Longimicrobium sp.]